VFLHVVDFKIASAAFDTFLDEDTGEGGDFGEVVGGFGACVAPETDEGFHGGGMDTEPLEVEWLEDFVGIQDGSCGSGRQRCRGVGCCGKGELVVEEAGYGCGGFCDGTAQMSRLGELFQDHL